jgi:hypothetical protein
MLAKRDRELDFRRVRSLGVTSICHNERSLLVTVKKISQKLYHLPKFGVLAVLEFVEFLDWNKDRLVSQ